MIDESQMNLRCEWGENIITIELDLFLFVEESANIEHTGRLR